MALKRIKIQNENNEVIGEYHKINNVNSEYDTISIEIYSSEQDRIDFKNGVFDSRFKKTDSYTCYRAGLKDVILTNGLAVGSTNLYDSIIAYAYLSLKTESDFYSEEFFENC
jgi:hypothetical protein